MELEAVHLCELAPISFLLGLLDLCIVCQSASALWIDQTSRFSDDLSLLCYYSELDESI